MEHRGIYAIGGDLERFIEIQEMSSFAIVNETPLPMNLPQSLLT